MASLKARSPNGILVSIVLFILLIILGILLFLISASSELGGGGGKTQRATAHGGGTSSGGERSGYAWVTLVMSSDDYVPGALVLAESLRRAGTQFQRVCMVTKEVSQRAKAALERAFDRVVVVPVIKATVRPLPGSSQRTRYPKEFLSASFTKWNCLALPYDKVCFVDADIAFRKSPDVLFDLQAPAGSFVNPWQPRDPIYNYPAHGDTVPHQNIRRALRSRNGFAVFGSLVLLRPDCEDFMELLRRLQASERYGDKFKTHSGPDELSITELYALRDINWTHISPRYHAIAWKNYGPNLGILAPEDIIGYHYFGAEKPWDLPPKTKVKWPDLKTWWDAAASLAQRARKGGWWEVIRKYVPVPAPDDD